MAITVSGAAELRAALGKIDGQVREQLAAAVQAEADDVVRDARSHVREDSGDLGRSISAEVGDLSAEIRPRSRLSEDSPRDHAIKANVNEFGRNSDPGQPYMVPAAEASRARWPKRARDAVNKATGG